MLFSLLDLEINDTCDGIFHRPPLINVATLPCESRNTENAYEHKFGF